MFHRRIDRVGLVFWEGYLGSAPSVINAVRLLAEVGYEVDVFIRKNHDGHAPPPSFDKNVRVLERRLHSLRIFEWLLNNLSQRTKGPKGSLTHPEAAGDCSTVSARRLWWRIKTLRRTLYLLLSEGAARIEFALFCLRHLLANQYVCLLGFDTDGIAVATVGAILKNLPVLYWSLEIRFLDENPQLVWRICKNLEKLCSRRAVCTIIQDAQRAESLVSENNLDPARIMIVPNGPLGPANIARTDFLQKRFGLSSSCRLVLQMGMISPATLSLELAEAANGWSGNYKLVLHDRVKRRLEESYIERIQHAGNGRLLLSLDPVPYDQIDNLVGSAHVGVVLYQESLGPNFSLIAGASGKLGNYLRCALPVVCLDLPGLGDLIRKYECGVCIDSVEQTTEALTTIFADYERYSQNAIACYEEAYEFGAHFQKVIQKIQCLRP